MSIGGGRVGSAWYELELKDQGFFGELRDLEGELKRTGDAGERAFGDDLERGIHEADRALDGLERQLDDVDRKTGSIGGSFLGAAKTGASFGAGLLGVQLGAEAVSQAISFAGDAISLASDKAEAASKVQVLFGESYGILERASKSAATSVGLSSGAYLAAAGDVGNLITNFGLAGDEAAYMTKNVVQLAADMGSFNNASTAEVTEAIGAAFRGESEPIRRFGVMLDVAATKAKAVEMGLIGVGDELTPTARLMASYQLIVDQTGKAQGDFARTSTGWANSQRIANARIQESMTRLGEALMPLAASILPPVTAGIVGMADVLLQLANVVIPIVVGALELIGETIAGVGDAINNLHRFVDGELASQQDLASELDRLSKLYGVDAEAILARVEAQKEAKRYQDELASSSTALITTLQQMPGVWDGMTDDEKNAAISDLVAKVGALGKAAGDVPYAMEDFRIAIDGIVTQTTEFDGQLVALEGRLGLLPTAAGNATKALTATQQAMVLIRDELIRQGRTRELTDALFPWLSAGPRVVGEAESFGRDVGTAYGTGATSALSSTGWREAIENPVRKGTEGAIHAIAGMGTGLKAELQSAEAQVKEAMADLRWAIANPGAWEKTLRTIENAIEDSEVRQAAFLAAGNERAAALEEANQARLVGIWEDTTRQGYREGQRLTERRTKGMRENADEGPKLWRQLTAEERRAMLALVPVAERTGEKTTDGYADGSKRKDGRAPATWRDMTAKQRRYMLNLLEQAKGYGESTTDAYADGIAAGRAAAVEAGRGVVHAVGNVFRASSPPTSPLNPMRDIVTWGRRTMEAYGRGFADAGPGVAAAAARSLGPLAAALRGEAGGLDVGVMGEIRVRHEIDLRNAPPGITNAGVAQLVNADDATIYLRNLRQAELLPAVI